MERYDAILEQLKKAQSRGMETVTNRLDLVVQSLEELIHEAKSSVQGALPESADEVLPVDEIKTALDAYRQEAIDERQRSVELEAKIGELEQTADSAPHGTSIELIRALDEARTQSELLKELLPVISEHAARAVVLVLREGKVSTWSGIGFTDGEVLRSWQGDTADSSALATLLEVARPVSFKPSEDDLFQGWLADQETPGEILLIPVVLRGKLMGAIYVDQLEGHPWNPTTVQTLVAQVCWLIDTLPYRPTATPTLAEPVELGHEVEVIEPEAPPVDEYAAPETEIEAEEPVVEVEEPDVAAEEETDEEVEEEPGEADQVDHEVETPEVDPSATMKIDVSGMDFSETAPEDEAVTETVAETETEIAGETFEQDEPTEPEHDTAPESEFEPEHELDTAPETEVEPQPSEEMEEAAPEEPVEAEAAPPEVADIPTEVQMPVSPPEEEEKEEEPVEEAEDEEEPDSSKPQFLDEPPPVQPVQPPPEEPDKEISEDEAQREEARRFARLLVSEIKLYNEEQVERGREANDIYQRLREDIDRSREMFEKRISADVRESQDYFHDELVQILADGDADALGM